MSGLDADALFAELERTAEDMSGWLGVMEDGLEDLLKIPAEAWEMFTSEAAVE